MGESFYEICLEVAAQSNCSRVIVVLRLLKQSSHFAPEVIVPIWFIVGFSIFMNVQWHEDGSSLTAVDALYLQVDHRARPAVHGCAGKVDRARSRLHRSEILQENMRDLHNALLCTVLLEVLCMERFFESFLTFFLLRLPPYVIFCKYVRIYCFLAMPVFQKEQMLFFTPCRLYWPLQQVFILF